MIRGTCLGFNWHQLFLLSYVEQWNESQKKMSYFHFPCGAGQKTEILTKSTIFSLKKKFRARTKCLV